MRFPNSLIVGAAKAGTTAFYEYVRQHPEIYVSSVKEPQFFGLENEELEFLSPMGIEPINNRAITQLEEYLALFKDAPKNKCLLEASTSYLYLPKAADRIHHYIPEVKLIAILRNPVQRAYSNFLYLTRDGREPLINFSKALAEEPMRQSNNWSLIYFYRDLSLYYSQLKRYFDRFDRSQLHIVLYDDFRANPIKTLQETFSFLDVNPNFQPNISRQFNVSGLPKNKLIHKVIAEQNFLKSTIKSILPSRFRFNLKELYYERNLSKPTISEETRLELIEIFREDILKTQDLIGRDLSAWLN
jgi:hypothetical protein